MRSPATGGRSGQAGARVGATMGNHSPSPTMAATAAAAAKISPSSRVFTAFVFSPGAPSPRALVIIADGRNHQVVNPHPRRRDLNHGWCDGAR